MAETYFISTGEPSGDLLAADLVRNLRAMAPALKPFGVVGPEMRRAAVEGVFGIEDLSVMGFVEVLKHLPNIRMLEARLLEAIQRQRPRFAVLVDYPGFHMHFAAQLKRLGIPVIQYVAPQLWAWGEKRTEKLRQVTDLVLGIMPFEEVFFQERGVNFAYAGTPQVDRVQGLQARRSDFAVPEGKPLLGIFCGSRYGEVLRIAPAMQKVVREAQKKHDRHFLISVAPGVSLEAYHAFFDGDGELASATRAIADLGHYTLGDRTFVKGSSLKLMHLSDAALVTSGTATLECGLCQTPLAAVYITSALTYQMAKRLVKLPYISLVNLVAGKKIIAEFVQHIDPVEVAAHLKELSIDTPARTQVLQELGRLSGKLRGEPGRHGAEIICSRFAPQGCGGGTPGMTGV